MRINKLLQSKSELLRAPSAAVLVSKKAASLASSVPVLINALNGTWNAVLVGNDNNSELDVRSPYCGVDEAHPRTMICGVQFSCFNRDNAAEYLLDASLSGRGGYVCVTGAHGVVYAQSDEKFRSIINQASMNTLDGQPVVVIARSRGFNAGRVTGRELVRDVISKDRKAQVRHVLFGANDTVTSKMSARMKELNCAIKVDSFHPPYGEISEPDLIGMCEKFEINGATIVWVGISTPRQEQMAVRLSKLLPHTPIVAIGAAFDFVAGLKPEAPRLVTMLCLEWLFRLLTEPRRLFSRYATVVPSFMYYVFRYATRAQDHR